MEEFTKQFSHTWVFGRRENRLIHYWQAKIAYLPVVNKSKNSNFNLWFPFTFKNLQFNLHHKIVSTSSTFVVIKNSQLLSNLIFFLHSLKLIASTPSKWRFGRKIFLEQSILEFISKKYRFEHSLCYQLQNYQPLASY